MTIWDLPTRLYHWLQAALFIGLIITGFAGKGPHVYLGLGLFTLIMWRLIWGLMGSETSRFTQFVRSPKTIIRYLTGKHEHQTGHNPAGGWMVILMIVCLLSQCIAGLIIADFFNNIPILHLWITNSVIDVSTLIHGITARLLLLLVALHLIAIFFYKLRAKPLLWAMIVGKQHSHSDAQITIISNSRALAIFVGCGLLTTLIVMMSFI